MQMNLNDEQRQIVLTRLATMMRGLQSVNPKSRAAILSDAIRHSVTNTECLRESLRLRVLSGDGQQANRKLVK
jgi:hypothetical protein